jgi:hypothetical protein
MRTEEPYVIGMRKHGKTLLAAIVGFTFFALPLATATAGGNMVVVELYTSQGCSSCPPADAALHEISKRDDVIALSLHVDYWDYIGWRDTFAQRQFGQRQVSYRDTWHKNVVYTPQIIVQGRGDLADSRPRNLVAAIATAQETDPPITVTVERVGGMLKCRIEPGPVPVSGTVWIAKYTKDASVEITRGENAGRTITYTNVVTNLSRIGSWSGSEPDEVAMPQPEPGEGVAIWIQDGEGGPILAAAKFENP